MPTTSNFGWTTPADTDLVKDGAAAIRTLGNGIDTSFLDLKGGTTGQILSKASNTDLDYTWINNDTGDITGVTAGTGISGGGTSGTVTVTNSMATAIDAKGDLIAGTGADTFDRLAVGTNGQYLSADSTATTGLKWVTASSSGLTLIQRTSFTNVASQTFDSVFSSTYKAYLIVAEKLYGASAGSVPYLQMRYGSTTQTASYYGNAVAYNSGSTISTTASANASQFSINRRFGNTADENVTFSMYIQGVGNASEKPSAYGNTFSMYDSEAGFNGFWVNSAQTYTGFILSSSSGNIYGTVAVYGLAK